MSLAIYPDSPLPAKPKKRPAPEALPDAGESRGAVGLTVAWMLVTLSCLAAQIAALAMWLIARAAGIPAGRPNALMLVVSTLLIVAILAGGLVLVLTPLAYRVRIARPPTAVTIAAIAIALTPVAMFFILVLASGSPSKIPNPKSPIPNPNSLSP